MDQLMLTPEERLLLDLTAAPLAPERQRQLADFVLSEIHDEKPQRDRRRWFGFLAAFLAALTLGGGVAAYAWIARSEAPKDPYVVYCFADQNPDRGEGWVGATITAVPDLQGKNKPKLAAVASCAEAWDLGALRPPGTPGPMKNSGNPVPQLTGCIDDDGVAVVFPADSSICTRLGYASLL